MKVKALVLASVVALLAAACGGPAAAPSASTSAGAASASPSAQPVELLVWTHLTGPERDEIDKVAQAWAKSTGNKVTVVLDSGDFSAAVTAIAGGKGPDIMYGLPHDNLGNFQKAGQLAAVPAGVIDASAYVPQAIAATSYDGKQYAVPVSMEAIGLFYRTDKVQTPPATFEDLRAQAKSGLGFKYDIKNFYFTYGFIGANGGYVFKDKGNGSLDPSDIGLGNDGAKNAYKLLQDLVVSDKLMTKDETGDTAKAAFQSGKSAFYISGPWDVDGFKKANVKFAVTKIPTVNGKPFTPFIGVQAAFVNAKTSDAKQKAAWDLIKKLQTDLPLQLFKVGNRIPAQKALLNDSTVKADANVAAFAASAQDGVPMPNIAAMAAVWGPAGGVLDLLAQNKITPAAAGDKVVKDIKDGIAQQK
jgi:arabinogalactan oligomer/maltooligosaccharide transport system substrate-binding protein